MYYTPKQASSFSFIGPYLLWLVPLMFYVGLTQSGACGVNPQRFERAAHYEGLSSAVQGGYDYMECGAGDVWVSTFSAQRDAELVQGTMCCGMFKGCTVRWW